MFNRTEATRYSALQLSLLGAATLAGLILLLMAGFLLRESWPALSQIPGWRFFTDSGWFPQAGGEAQYNLWPMLVGTLVCTLLAMLLATPIGVGTAVFMQAYASPMSALVLRRILEVLAGIPSVVYGLLGLVLLVPLIRQWAPPGASVLAGSLVLGLMILPTVALFADNALAAVPRGIERGARALGFRPWRTVVFISLPAARGGILAGMILAAGRALGETMAVMMVAGNVVQLPGSVFDPVRVLTANIALEMAYALDLHRAALFVTGLLLTALVSGLILIAGRLGGGVRHV